MALHDSLRRAALLTFLLAGFAAPAAARQAGVGTDAGAAPVPPGAIDPAPPVVAPPVAPLPPPPWQKSDAQALLAVIRGIGAEGLIPADYHPAELAAAIAAGEGPQLDAVATEAFTWLAEDLRDGRTPMDSRRQWYAVDPDSERMPNAVLLASALERHDVRGTLSSLLPVHPDYAALRERLAKTAPADTKTAAMIRANMDRWRWLAQDLGKMYLITNVPEYMLRLTVNDKIITSYRTIVGKPGKTATPQLAEMVEGVIFNPTWTVPQSIVKGEGLGAQLLANPARARRMGYVVTKAENGFVTVVQQPGPGNSLGKMKLDMPNPHAIFIHDTPARNLFAEENRALSHGCIRAERASELAMMMAILGAGMTKEEGIEHTLSGEYTKVPFTRQIPVYITYFTMARDVKGALRTFDDLYGRDAPVIASFAEPRQLKTLQKTTSEPVVAIEAPGA